MYILYTHACVRAHTLIYIYMYVYYIVPTLGNFFILIFYADRDLRYHTPS